PVLTRPDARDRPNPRELRTVLYQHAFNPARPAGPGSAAAQILDWAQQASLPVGCLSEPTVLRTALEALTFRLDGSRAAANTIIRKHASPHSAPTPRTAAAGTSSGTSHEQRGLKHRPDGTIRMVPAPPVLATMLRAHHAAYGTAPDGRLFRGARGGPLSGSVYGRA